MDLPGVREGAAILDAPPDMQTFRIEPGLFLALNHEADYARLFIGLDARGERFVRSIGVSALLGGGRMR